MDLETDIASWRHRLQRIAPPPDQFFLSWDLARQGNGVSHASARERSSATY
jgi:hypothetical protein